MAPPTDRPHRAAGVFGLAGMTGRYGIGQSATTYFHVLSVRRRFPKLAVYADVIAIDLFTSARYLGANDR